MVFPLTTYWKTLNTSEVITAGGITVPADTHLQSVYLWMYKHGQHGGGERLRVRVYHDSSLQKLYATSDWSAIADIPSLPTYWRGRLLFTFSSRVWLNDDSTYFLAVEADGYTRNVNTFYLAFLYDWPQSINVNMQEPRYGLALENYGERGVDYE